jgi:signal transduction histidine kinase
MRALCWARRTRSAARKVCEDLARIGRAERRQAGGLGIGLALVRRIALIHGGDVQVEDRPGADGDLI